MSFKTKRYIFFEVELLSDEEIKISEYVWTTLEKPSNKNTFCLHTLDVSMKMKLTTETTVVDKQWAVIDAERDSFYDLNQQIMIEISRLLRASIIHTFHEYLLFLTFSDIHMFGASVLCPRTSDILNIQQCATALTSINRRNG